MRTNKIYLALFLQLSLNKVTIYIYIYKKTCIIFGTINKPDATEDTYIKIFVVFDPFHTLYIYIYITLRSFIYCFKYQRLMARRLKYLFIYFSSCLILTIDLLVYLLLAKTKRLINDLVKHLTSQELKKKKRGREREKSCHFSRSTIHVLTVIAERVHQALDNGEGEAVTLDIFNDMLALSRSWKVIFLDQFLIWFSLIKLWN